MTYVHARQGDLRVMAAEVYLARKLGQPGLFGGVTDAVTRRKRLARAISDQSMAATVVGKNREGQPETFEAAFQRLYGMTLSEVLL